MKTQAHSKIVFFSILVGMLISPLANAIGPSSLVTLFPDADQMLSNVFREAGINPVRVDGSLEESIEALRDLNRQFERLIESNPDAFKPDDPIIEAVATLRQGLDSQLLSPRAVSLDGANTQATICAHRTTACVAPLSFKIIVREDQPIANEMRTLADQLLGHADNIKRITGAI